MIYLSIGHHKERQGAEFEGLTEWMLATRWVEKIKAFDIDKRIVVVPTGYLKAKVAFINLHDPDIAAELHFNSSASGKATGCMMLHYPGSDKGKVIASAVQKGVVNLGVKDKGIHPGYFRMDPKNGVDFFLEKTKCPSIIMEPAYIQEKELLEKIEDDACRAIYEGLLEAEKEVRNG